VNPAISESRYDHRMRIDDYLARVGVAKPLPPTLDTLRRLHVAHLGAFTFDNLGIQLHRGVRVDIPSVEQKFLDGTTGGYCFEQNTLFGAVLRELGFEVTSLLARVAMAEPEQRFLSHMLLRVDIDGEPWLADVGFGAEGPLEPLPLRDHTVEVQGGLEYTLARRGSRWNLSMRCDDVTQEFYEFSGDPHTAADVEVANYYTSTHPESIFRRTLTIQRATPEERLILRPTVVTRYRNGARVDTPIEPAEIRARAKELFGVELGDGALLFEIQKQD
jgi:N-hydroxyarylamine O-acetyltransferase